MENQNKQRDVERELKELVQKYNVLDKSQLYAYFEKDGRERFVGRALKVLEKDRMIYVNNETKQVAANESAHTAWERHQHRFQPAYRRSNDVLPDFRQRCSRCGEGSSNSVDFDCCSCFHCLCKHR